MDARRCPNCGSEFTPTHHLQKYCNSTCRIAASNSRARGLPTAKKTKEPKKEEPLTKKDYADALKQIQNIAELDDADALRNFANLIMQKPLAKVQEGDEVSKIEYDFIKLGLTTRRSLLAEEQKNKRAQDQPRLPHVNIPKPDDYEYQ